MERYLIHVHLRLITSLCTCSPPVSAHLQRRPPVAVLGVDGRPCSQQCPQSLYVAAACRPAQRQLAGSEDGHAPADDVAGRLDRGLHGRRIARHQSGQQPGAGRVLALFAQPQGLQLLCKHTGQE